MGNAIPYGGLKCPKCGRPVPYGRRKYCSQLCQQRAQKEMMRENARARARAKREVNDG